MTDPTVIRILRLQQQLIVLMGKVAEAGDRVHSIRQNQDLNMHRRDDHPGKFWDSEASLRMQREAQGELDGLRAQMEQTRREIDDLIGQLAPSTD